MYPSPSFTRDSILRYHGMLVKTKKLALVPDCQLNSSLSSLSKSGISRSSLSSCCFPLSLLSSLEASHHIWSTLGAVWQGGPGTKRFLLWGAVSAYIIRNSPEGKISLTPTFNKIKGIWCNFWSGLRVVSPCSSL